MTMRLWPTAGNHSSDFIEASSLLLEHWRQHQDSQLHPARRPHSKATQTACSALHLLRMAASSAQAPGIRPCGCGRLQVSICVKKFKVEGLSEVKAASALTAKIRGDVDSPLRPLGRAASSAQAPGIRPCGCGPQQASISEGFSL